MLPLGFTPLPKMKPVAKILLSKTGLSTVCCFTDLVDELGVTGRDVNHRFAGRRTALHNAAEKDLLEAAKWLINKGADLEAKDQGEWTPLHLAARLNSLQVARLLIEKGADKNAKNNVGKKPIHYAKRRGHSEMVALLQ